jgi:hypothetical protein
MRSADTPYYVIFQQAGRLNLLRHEDMPVSEIVAVRDEVEKHTWSLTKLHNVVVSACLTSRLVIVRTTIPSLTVNENTRMLPARYVPHLLIMLVFNFGTLVGSGVLPLGSLSALCPVRCLGFALETKLEHG